MRIKVLLRICKPNVYQRFVTLFRGRFPHHLPLFYMGLRRLACFAFTTTVGQRRDYQIPQDKRDNKRVHYIPLSSATELSGHFAEHFNKEEDAIDRFLSIFKNATWGQCEIIATLRVSTISIAAFSECYSPRISWASVCVPFFSLLRNPCMAGSGVLNELRLSDLNIQFSVVVSKCPSLGYAHRPMLRIAPRLSEEAARMQYNLI